ncbi:FAD:protein FMN transferase [Paraglaciecola aquimarina]|uniref:FAD:protein FMN transferase n=1 Tax=Paraglaciecola aquimarina TaxID=1235557 RepID=A0ABU3STZ7_9ALTE|nr:FAD:protein FMN transferase [Paraglaciecola aquimarina]MDU0353489.1 FAD:protein FMN transferase [Paraglaciecola aquimarina]
MASPCELLIDSQDRQLAEQLTAIAFNECQRIEQKYSRYRRHNLIDKINNSNGQKIAIDDETYRLLDFANTCYAISEGLFDITSGVLRKVWKFDGSDNIPTQQQVQKILPHIGWSKIVYDKNNIAVPDGMQLDFGGIGKEYAVDSVAKLCVKHAPSVSVVVNFGGDIQVTCARQNNQAWLIGIESFESQQNAQKGPQKVLSIQQGGLATSGDAKRFLLKDGIRYGHILNPKTGYPIEGSARSITVASKHCIQAGLLATLALLQGSNAEEFLQQQGVKFWCYR